MKDNYLTFLLNKVRKSVKGLAFDYELPGEFNSISENKKTESFIDFCFKKEIDSDEVLEKIVFQEEEMPYLSKNKYGPGMILVWEISENYSKQNFPKISEPIYCKVCYNKNGVLKVVLHRSWSDVK